MKKKGLIIATIVMVLVLAVSLTTATYAWFQVASTTTIDGFNVQVVPGSDVMIGLKKDNTYKSGAISEDFVSGTVAYTPESTAGVLGLGDWTTGTPGLGYSIDHSITWGDQSMAVGVTTESTLEAATVANTGLWNKADGATAIAANGDNQSSIDVAKGHLAVANSDYVYMFLGVQPVVDLTVNNIVIVLNADAFIAENGKNAGILSAVHIAYRYNGATAWTDVDLFGDVNYNEAIAALTFSDLEKNVYSESYEENVPAKGAKWSLGLTKTAGAIDQLEIVIYIAGADSDANHGSLNGAKGAIEIFFVTSTEAQG